MTGEPDKIETDMEFFRLINKVIDPCEEIRMEVRAALANTFGDDHRGANESP